MLSLFMMLVIHAGHKIPFQCWVYILWCDGLATQRGSFGRPSSGTVRVAQIGEGCIISRSV